MYANEKKRANNIARDISASTHNRGLCRPTPTQHLHEYPPTSSTKRQIPTSDYVFPHIAGLLAYFLSLQPSEDSAFGVAAITPKKLKEHIISIATPGKLSDVPSDTANVSFASLVFFTISLIALLARSSACLLSHPSAFCPSRIRRCRR